LLRENDSNIHKLKIKNIKIELHLRQ